MKELSPGLKALLVDLRQHHAFTELLTVLATPVVPRYRKSQAEHVEKARADWIYASGKRDQHDAWLALLTGRPIPHDAE